MLAEVDRARQAAKALESELAREQQRRAKSVEAAAKRLEAELAKLHQVRESARSMEAELRDRLAVLGIELAQPVPKAQLPRRRMKRCCDAWRRKELRTRRPASSSSRRLPNVAGRRATRL